MALYLKTQEKIQRLLDKNSQSMEGSLVKFFTHILNCNKGIEEIAKELNLTKKTLYNWLEFRSTPTKNTTAKIKIWLNELQG